MARNTATSTFRPDIASLALGSVAAAFVALQFAHRLAVEPQLAAITTAVTDIADMSREGCVSLEESAEIKSCVFGSESPAMRVVLFGDSHAIQWFNALKRIATERNWRLTTFVKSHCPAPDLGPPWRSAGCSAWRAAVLRELKTQRPDLVVLASATRYLDADSVLVWQEATGRTLAALAATGLHVAVIRDTPVAPFNIPLAWRVPRGTLGIQGGQCGFPRAPALRPAFYAAERRVRRSGEESASST